MNRILRANILITTLSIGIAASLGGLGKTQDVKPAPPPQDDLQSRVEDLADFFAPFIQEGNTGKAVFFDLVGPKGLRAPFGNWLADQISTSITRRYPALHVIDRSTISSLLDKRNREADQESRAGHLWEPKRDRAYAKQAGAEKCIFGNFSKVPRGLRIDFYFIGPKPVSGGFSAILPVTDQVARLLPPGLETEMPKGESGGASSARVAEPQCLWCPVEVPFQWDKRSNCHGTIIFNVHVNTEGRATDIQNVQGPERCADMTGALVERVRRWWFQPAQNADGKAEPGMTTLRLAF
jgi:hypothetical protein